MGLHTANPISGDFSFGIQGQLIENGEKACPIRGITLAGNLVELMQSIVAVGNDLRFSSSIGSPTLVVENLAVGGDN
jgi:PmbA protein